MLWAGFTIIDCQAAGMIDEMGRCALWSLHSSGAIVSPERADERVHVDGPSYRSGAGDDMLMLLRGRTSYVDATKLPPYLYVDEPLQVEAAGGGMIGKSKGTRTMA